jgi:hypothetical protein
MLSMIIAALSLWVCNRQLQSKFPVCLHASLPVQGDLLCAEILWSSMRQNLPPGQRSRLLGCLMHKVVPTGARATRAAQLHKTVVLQTGAQPVLEPSWMPLPF